MQQDAKLLKKIARTAIDAARLAGEQAKKEIKNIRISVKNKNEIVTQADGKCQNIIIKRVRQDFEGHGFVAEEGKEGQIFKQPPRPDQPFWWVIDPIDGTNNFSHKMSIFTISIAVMHRGEPVVGVIYDPFTDSMYWGIKGADAKCNGKKIVVSQDPIDMFASIGMDSHFNSKLPNWAEQIILNTKHRSLGTTALHFAYAAKGSFIAAVAPKTKLWDFAAGCCIAQAAGAIISNLQGEKLFPVDLESYNGENLNAMAANKTVYRELVKLINS